MMTNEEKGEKVMIKTKILANGLVKTYSDEGYKIRQDGTGRVYDTAIDPADTGRTYTETEEPIAGATEAERLLTILTGGAE